MFGSSIVTSTTSSTSIRNRSEASGPPGGSGPPYAAQNAACSVRVGDQHRPAGELRVARPGLRVALVRVLGLGVERDPRVAAQVAPP